MFEHLKQLWMGIWQHTHTVTTTEVSPDFGELAEILDDVTVERLQIINGMRQQTTWPNSSGCRPNRPSLSNASGNGAILNKIWTVSRDITANCFGCKHVSCKQHGGSPAEQVRCKSSFQGRYVIELLTGSNEKYGSRKNGYAQRKFYVEHIDYTILLTISTMQVFRERRVTI